jgi:NTE family protein
MISPHALDGRLLADGGILDPLPVAPIATANADLTVAVSLSGEDADARRDQPTDAEPSATAEWLNRLLRSTSQLLETPAARSVLGRLGTPADAELDEEPTEEEAVATVVPKLSGFEVMNRTIDIMQAALARHHLASYPLDILIEVPRTAIRSLEFHRASDVIDVGRALAARALDGYEADNISGDAAANL